jgi:hypothetical protein
VAGASQQIKAEINSRFSWTTFAFLQKRQGVASGFVSPYLLL